MIVTHRRGGISMEQNLFLASILCILGFFIVSWLTIGFSKIFDIELPDTVSFILFLLAVFVIIGERELLFQKSATLTGFSVGVLSSILWNIRNKRFFRNMIKTMLSFRFLLWVGTTAAGIYKREIVLDAWEKFILLSSAIYRMRIVFYIVIIALYIMGSIFILFPKSKTSTPERTVGFSMVSRNKKSSKVLKQIIGAVIVILSSALLHEAISFFINM